MTPGNVLPNTTATSYPHASGKISAMVRADKKQQDATISCEALKPFSANYVRLSKIQGVEDGDIEKTMKKSKVGKVVSKKTLNNIRNLRHPPELSNLEAVANYFQIPLWIMFLDELPPEFLLSPDKERLARLVRDYLDCDERPRADAENLVAAHANLKRAKKAQK